MNANVPTAKATPGLDRAEVVLNFVVGITGGDSNEVADTLVHTIMLLALLQPAPQAALADAARMLQEAGECMPASLRKDH